METQKNKMLAIMKAQEIKRMAKIAKNAQIEEEADTYRPLTLAELRENIGKKIEWFAYGAEDNAPWSTPYCGTAILRGIRKTTDYRGNFLSYRLDCEAIKIDEWDDDLQWAFLDCGEARLERNPECEEFFFTDSDRTVYFRIAK